MFPERRNAANVKTTQQLSTINDKKIDKRTGNTRKKHHDRNC